MAQQHNAIGPDTSLEVYIRAQGISGSLKIIEHRCITEHNHDLKRFFLDCHQYLTQHRSAPQSGKITRLEYAERDFQRYGSAST